MISMMKCRRYKGWRCRRIFLLAEQQRSLTSRGCDISELLISRAASEVFAEYQRIEVAVHGREEKCRQEQKGV